MSSESKEKGDMIATNMDNKESIYVGKYKSGEEKYVGKIRPEYSKQRMVIYGKAGSGKSTYASLIMSSYHRQYPDNDIILISPHKKEDEKPFAKQLGYLKQMEIPDEPEVIDATEEFKDCLVFIDDMKGFKTKAQNLFVFKLAKDIFYNCRKYGVSCIVTNHEILDGNFNKLFNYEAEQVTFFVASRLSWRQIRVYCEKYLGMDKDIVEYIRDSDSRWITVQNVLPSFIMTQKEIIVI